MVGAVPAILLLLEGNGKINSGMEQVIRARRVSGEQEEGITGRVLGNGPTAATLAKHPRSAVPWGVLAAVEREDEVHLGSSQLLSNKEDYQDSLGHWHHWPRLLQAGPGDGSGCSNAARVRDGPFPLPVPVLWVHGEGRLPAGIQCHCRRVPARPACAKAEHVLQHAWDELSIRIRTRCL